MKLFKVMAMALVVAFSLSLVLSGCGKKESSSETQTTQNQSTQKDTKKSITLKFYTDSDESTNQMRKYPALIAEFEKRNPGVKVEAQPLVANYNSDEYAKKAALMIAGGEQIDVLISSTLEEVMTRAKAGILEPMNEYATKEGVDLEKEYNGIIPIDGKIYTIPEYVTSWLVYINKDMLDAAGLPIPPRDWTWADYREYAKKLTKGEGASKVYGSYMHNWDWFFSIGMQSKIMDKPYFYPDGKHRLADPIFKDGMQYRYDLENVDKSQVPYVDLKAQKLAYRSVFFGGKAAMLPMGAWMVADIKNVEKYPHTFKTVFATFPRWDESCKPNTTTLDGAGSGWGVNAKSQYKEEAYKFVRFLTSEGWEMAHGLWSAWTKSNQDETIKGIAGPDENLYDIQALKNVLFDPERVQNKYTFVGPGEKELLDMYIQENEKYLTGGEDLDTAINNIIKRADEIVAKAKK
jgi:multiple sugar transport system substrate-binding protein